MNCLSNCHYSHCNIKCRNEEFRKSNLSSIYITLKKPNFQYSPKEMENIENDIRRKIYDES